MEDVILFDAGDKRLNPSTSGSVTHVMMVCIHVEHILHMFTNRNNYPFSLFF